MELIKSQLPKLKALFIGALLILFTQFVKSLRAPESYQVTVQTFTGLLVLVLFSFIGVLIAELAKKSGVKVLADFPVLGWVSLTSLLFCLLSNVFVDAIGGVSLLSITTPVLAYAGLSVANSLGDLTKNSWKYLIVALFVFVGSYLGRILIAQFGIMVS